MPEPTLKLSEHELYFLPPGTPATAPAPRVEVEIDGEMRVFLARWICDVDNWCVLFYCREDGEEILTHSGRISGETIAAYAANRDDEINFIINFVMPPPVLRHWCSSDKKYGLIVEKKGRVHLVIKKQKTTPKPIMFGIKIPWDAEEFTDYPQSEFIGFCQSMSDNADSVLNQALRWENLAPEQKDSITFKCDFGDWEGLRYHCLLAAKIVTHLCGQLPPIIPPSIDTVSRWKIDLVGPREDAPLSLQWLLRWGVALRRIYRPAFEQAEPAFVREWRRNRDIRCVVQCTMPTAHEALEAQLELRDFLRPHLSDDEIEALMRPE